MSAGHTHGGGADHGDNRAEEQHLRAAMASHNLIGQAQGILMERFHMTAEQAFALLAQTSQDANIKLRDLAQRLIDAGDTPGR